MTLTDRQGVRRSLKALQFVIVLWLDIAAVYQFFLVMLAYRAKVESTRRDAEVLDTIVLVPAHDEAAVIEACLRSLHEQQPALKPGRVIVIADNCTDETAKLSRAAGATVWERTDDANRGKGHALAWAIDRIQRELTEVDVVGVVDADCVAMPNLVSGWSTAIRSGTAAAQADYRIANPEQSASAARRWAGFALRNRIRGVAKERVGLSVGLYGTGMAFSAETLERTPWDSFSVTEDAEYHARIVESGGRVAFVADTAVESNAPVTEAEAHTQQMRWESGNVALARKTVPQLLRNGIRRREATQLNLALEQSIPPQSILAAGLMSFGALGFVFKQRMVSAAVVAAVAAETGYVIFGLKIAGAPPAVWRSLLTAPVLVGRKVSQFLLIGAGRASRDWNKTQR